MIGLVATHPLVRAIRLELARNADAAKAGPMRAYMKSEMPYRGVMTGPLRRITREIFAGHPLEGFAEWLHQAVISVVLGGVAPGVDIRALDEPVA